MTTKNCNRCQTPFTPKTDNQAYCNEKCRIAASVKRWSDKNKKNCTECGKKIKHSSTICKDCQTGSTECKKKTIGEYRNSISVKNKHPSWVSAHIRNFNRSWNKDLTSLPCQKCGYARHTELAHIKPVSSFDDSELLITVNHPSNILVLCPTHHWEFDNNVLLLEEIPSRSSN